MAVSSHHLVRKQYGCSSQFYKWILLSLFGLFNQHSCSWLFHNSCYSSEFKKLFVGGPVIKTDPGEDCMTEVNALIQLKFFVWQMHDLSSDSHHAKSKMWNLFSASQSKKSSHSGKFINSCSSWQHHFTLWLLHNLKCWPFELETQDDWNFLSLAAAS